MPRLLSLMAAPVAAVGFTSLTAGTLWSLGATQDHDPRVLFAATAFGTLAPALFVALSRASLRATLWTLALWNLGLFSCLGIWVPEQRVQGLRTFLSLAPAGNDVSQALAARVRETIAPESPDPHVRAVSNTPPKSTPSPAPALAARDIVLPYEGEGRRLTVPVVFVHDGFEVETLMMLDTGATYTTLPLKLLTNLHAQPGRDAPELTLNTANGTRVSHVTLVDEVWLGDLALHNVAITACEDCAGSDSAGLLGLNVAGGFNVTIDADRREVVFHQREVFNRVLDIRPFTDLAATFTRLPNGRVHAKLLLDNRSGRAIGPGLVRVRCDAGAWDLDVGPIEAGETYTATRPMPPEATCEGWTLELTEASWGP